MASEQGAVLTDGSADLALLLNLIRAGDARTRPELARISGLGRTAVSRRLGLLVDAGLVSEGELGPSTGGRAPRRLHFHADVGLLAVAELGATSVAVGVADVNGELLATDEQPWDISRGPESTLERTIDMLEPLIAAHHAPLWGVGLGLPGPVEFATGRPISPPIMPGWNQFPVCETLAARLHAPVWADNDVNVLALGELRVGHARGERDVIYVKIGTGIGAGIISDGHLYRGAQGCAGDIGHIQATDDPTVICRCGQVGCLEALAGGAALARQAQLVLAEGRSPYLAAHVAPAQAPDSADVISGAQSGDAVCVELLNEAAERVGDVLATLVSFYNPSLLVIGGRLSAAGDGFLAAIRQRIYQRSLPLATRDLRIVFSALGHRGGLVGAAAMTVDQLLRPEALQRLVS